MSTQQLQIQEHHNNYNHYNATGYLANNGKVLPSH